MLSFLAIPSILKDKVKKDYPEATFFVAEDLDSSMHGKPKTPRKKREKKIEPESKCAE